MILSTLLVRKQFYGIDFDPLKLNALSHFINQMEKVNFGFSLKNIGTPNQRTYELWLIEKIELFI